MSLDDEDGLDNQKNSKEIRKTVSDFRVSGSTMSKPRTTYLKNTKSSYGGKFSPTDKIRSPTKTTKDNRKGFKFSTLLKIKEKFNKERLSKYTQECDNGKNTIFYEERMRLLNELYEKTIRPDIYSRDTVLVDIQNYLLKYIPNSKHHKKKEYFLYLITKTLEKLSLLRFLIIL